jgi:hypothetical protein
VRRNAVYARRSIWIKGGKGKDIKVYLHQFLMGVKGVDHKDGNGLNNRRNNLRIATLSQQMYNTAKRSDNTSGVKGVWWHAQCGKWCAQIETEGRKISLGLFATLDAAAQARHAAEVKYHGTFAR